MREKRLRVRSVVPPRWALARSVPAFYVVFSLYTAAAAFPLLLGLGSALAAAVLAVTLFGSVFLLQKAIERVGSLPNRPSFVLHTGDVSHTSMPAQYDAVDQILKGAKFGQDQVYYVPGEHDTFVDNGKAYLDRFGQGSTTSGWRSFDFKGVHFVGLVNVWNLKAGGFGVHRDDQLAWLKKDLDGLSASTPVVVYAHVPLWALYPTWGWGTTDAEQALSMMRRFGSVTVLNGHIHQVLQKVEGNVTFHTAASTAYPQPHPARLQPLDRCEWYQSNWSARLASGRSASSKKQARRSSSTPR